MRHLPRKPNGKPDYAAVLDWLQDTGWSEPYLCTRNETIHMRKAAVKRGLTLETRLMTDTGGFLLRVEPKEVKLNAAEMAARDALVKAYPLMKSGNTLEFKQRLQLLSEGMLHNKTYRVRRPMPSDVERALYRQYLVDSSNL